MSDDELPGAQLHRTVISMDDVSDDDDDGFAMLQTGKERKEALRKAETEKAKRKLADSRTSTGDGEEEDDVVCTSGPAASKRPARASRTAAPASNSAGTVVDSPGLELEEQDHALLARQAKQKEEIDRMRAAFLADDEDEDEDGGTPSARTRVAPPHVPRTTARGGGLEGAREKQLWVTAKCLSLGADSYEMFRADRDVPLREGLVQKVAETFGLLPPRVQFSMEPQTGEVRREGFEPGPALPPSSRGTHAPSSPLLLIRCIRPRRARSLQARRRSRGCSTSIGRPASCGLLG